VKILETVDFSVPFQQVYLSLLEDIATNHSEKILVLAFGTANIPSLLTTRDRVRRFVLINPALRDDDDEKSKKEKQIYHHHHHQQQQQQQNMGVESSLAQLKSNLPIFWSLSTLISQIQSTYYSLVSKIRSVSKQILAQLFRPPHHLLQNIYKKSDDIIVISDETNFLTTEGKVKILQQLECKHVTFANFNLSNSNSVLFANFIASLV